MKEKTPELVKTKWGFYQYRPIPSETELEDYYANKYYQQGLGSYDVSYGEEEINYYRLKSRLIFRKAESLLPSGRKKFVDMGCGEGWTMAELHRHGHSVRGMDFSQAGIEKFHPHLIPFFKKGNVYEHLKNFIDDGKIFDLIMLCNVIEHVTQPVGLLEDIRQIMNSDSVLMITVPNDFSPLHDHLMKGGYISKKWWLAYPDHLSYFNKENMCCLLDDLGFVVKCVIADNPVDLNIMNDNSNYIEERSKGRNVHMFRVRADNFLGGMAMDKLLQIYEILGSMGVGRDLTFYCSLKA